MTQLKTLKDISFFPQRKYEIDEELKAEAIKWVKELENALWDETDEGKYDEWKERLEPFEVFYNDEYNSFSEVIEWIKHFFNLTDEDLKEQGAERTK